MVGSRRRLIGVRVGRARRSCSGSCVAVRRKPRCAAFQEIAFEKSEALLAMCMVVLGRLSGGHDVSEFL